MEAYRDIYQKMKDKYCEESGAEIDEASDIAIRLKVLAGEIYNMQCSMDWLQRQMFPDTATGEYLDKFAHMRGLERRPATKARGTLTFYVNEVKDTAVPIPQGTVVSTGTEQPVRVYTTEDSELPPNTLSVTVPAEAEVAGYRGNIKIRTAVVPVSVPSEINQVCNISLFTGGADRESDTTLRRRIQDSYYNQPNGMNAAYYIALAESVDGIFKAGVVPRGSGTGSVDVYVCGGNESVLPEEKLTEVENFLKSQRELNVSVKVKQAYSVDYDLDVAVTPKPGYSQEEVVELCTDAFEAYIETIPIGGKFYLATLGKYLLDTGCLETYVFDLSMGNMTIPMSKYFVAGDINIEVTSA